jgi:hypothetical protein
VPLYAALEPGSTATVSLTGGLSSGAMQPTDCTSLHQMDTGAGREDSRPAQEVLRERRVSTRTWQGRDAHRSGRAEVVRTF